MNKREQATDMTPENIELLLARYEELEKQHSVQSREIYSLEHSAASFKKIKTSLHKENLSFKTANTRLQKQNSALTIKTSELTRKTSELTRKTSELTCRTIELESQKIELKNNQSALENNQSELERKNIELKAQLEWFKRQIFGEKSERRILRHFPEQITLGECFERRQTLPDKKETVSQYQRGKNYKNPLKGTPEDSGLRFDESEVPMEEIKIENPQIQGLSSDEYEVIGTKSSYRLAQRPGSYVVLKYTRETVKLKEDGKLVTPPAPPAVLEKSYADVSFLAGLVIDKLLYHLPLYRQHQRLQSAYIELSRSTLTNLVHRTADLLEPVYLSILSSILQSKVLAMDETSIKAGRKSAGKMKKSYFWPIYGDMDEIAFVFSHSRGTNVVHEALSEWCGVLVTDGYKVYDRFTSRVNGVTHAQCWVHARRYFDKSKKVEPELSGQALELIGQIYHQEKIIRESGISGISVVEQRALHVKPIVDEFFNWLKDVVQDFALLPRSPFTKAVYYSLERESGLRVFLEYSDVPPDTNHIERALRPIPMGRKAWLFCWTELGAKYVGILQSILQSCKLHGVHPYTYLVDILQRIETHPARDVHLLTPRLWKENFADNPMCSDIDRKN